MTDRKGDGMLERMARAMAYDWFSCDFEREDALKAADKDWKDFLGPARAALMAMREPSEAVAQRIWEIVYQGGTYRAGFAAAIDAILAEKSE